ncbi:hypothetical protein [Poseidonibacter antarcticus]|uniref:hypothetical protein n=1 Tax=Poseidonibacter antarcticus TaxID=2478538 RepID=UPI000EF4F4E0|nr:hypothetical protein [Poseidonibacter antarcticus]
MLKQKVEEFLKKQFEDIEESIYTIDIEDDFIFIEFTQILGEICKKEMMFRIIDENLQYHSLSYGWKVLNRGTNIRYFWIDLLNK